MYEWMSNSAEDNSSCHRIKVTDKQLMMISYISSVIIMHHVKFEIHLPFYNKFSSVFRYLRMFKKPFLNWARWPLCDAAATFVRFVISLRILLKKLWLRFFSKAEFHHQDTTWDRHAARHSSPLPLLQVLPPLSARPQPNLHIQKHFQRHGYRKMGRANLRQLLWLQGLRCQRRRQVFQITCL